MTDENREHLANIILVGLIVLALVIGGTCAALSGDAEQRWRAGIGRGGPVGDGVPAGAWLRERSVASARALPAAAWRPRVPGAGLAADALRYGEAGARDRLVSDGIRYSDEHGASDIKARLWAPSNGRGSSQYAVDRGVGDALPGVSPKGGGCPPGGGPPRCRRVAPAPPAMPDCRASGDAWDQAECVLRDNSMGAEWDSGRAQAIISCESGGDPWAVSPTNDRGLWQINARTWLRSIDWRAKYDLEAIYGPWYDPVSNTAMAVFIFRRAGRSWAPWSCAR